MSLQSSMNVFRGPLFVVGLPRSGTKLLRSLLNEHSQIQLTGVESGFLPYWASRWASYGDLSKKENFDSFYKLATKLSYFQYAKKGGWLISADAWFDTCQNYEITGVFEALMRHDVGMALDSSTIWGDKTPQYTNQLVLLHKLWPEAKFIHIIRDVRDYCLSMQNAWHKNMMRSAQRWVDDI